MAKMFQYNIILTPCCDIHDFCTSRCGHPDYEAHFLQCADAFKKCMYDLCEDKAQLISRRVRRALFLAGCKSTAYTFAVLVRRTGKKDFAKSQEHYCDCP